MTFENLPEFKSVGDYAFSDCKAIQSVTFENLPKFQSVGSYAFSDCKAIQSVTFENLPAFQSVGYSAFSDCDALQSVTFENLPKFKSVGVYAFRVSKSLADVTFKDAYVTLIGKGAFANTPLKNLKFIESEEKLDRPLSVDVDAFRNCNITKLELPKRYNKDAGSGFVNQIFKKTLTDEEFKNDSNYKLVKEDGKSYVTITNPISIKHGDSNSYLGSVEANPYVEILDGPNGEPKMLMKIKGNTALGETYNATWSNNELQIDNVNGKKGDIPFTGSVSLGLAFKGLGEVHLMKDEWKHDPINTIEVLRNNQFPSDKVLSAIKTSADSKVKDADIQRKLVYASVDMTKPADTVQNAVVRVYFVDGTTTDVEVPVKLTQTPADKFVNEVEGKELVATPEIVKQYGNYDLTDNFGKLPEGITIVETSKKINTAFVGDYEATVDIINKNGKDLKGVKVPVKVVPLDADNASIKTKEIVKEQGKGDNVDLTEGIEQYNLLNVQEVETLIPVTDKEVGRFNGKLKLTFKDKSTVMVYVPVEIVEKKKDFNAETQTIQVYKDHVVTNGDLRDAFKNLPANSEVIDLTSPPVDTSTVGEKSAKVKVVLKDGRTSEHVVLIKVVDPIGELEKQIEKDNEKINTLNENNKKLAEEIQKLQNQSNQLIIKLNQAEADKLDLQNQINTLTIEKNKLEVQVKANDELIKELRQEIADWKARAEELKEVIKGKDAEIAKLLEKIGKLETKIETLTKENTGLKEKLATATEKITNLEAKVKDLEGQVKGLNDEINKKVEEIKTLNQDITGLKEQIAKLESEKAKDKAQYEKDKAELETKLQEAKDNLAKKEEELSGLKTQLEEIKKELSDEKAKNAGLTEQVKAKDEKIADLEKQIEELKAKLEKANTANKAEKERLEKIISEKTTELETLKTEKTELEKQILVEKTKNENLEKQVADLTDKLNKAKEDLNKANDKIVELEKQLEVEQEKNKNLTEKVESLEKQLSEAKTTEKTLIEKVTELTTKIEKIEKEKSEGSNVSNEEITKLKEEKAALESKLEGNAEVIKELREQIKDLKDQVAKADKENEELKSKIAELEKKLEALTKENTDLKEKLATATEKITNLEAKNKELEDKVNDLTDKNKDLEDKIENADKKNKDLEDKIANLESEKKDLEDKLEIEKSKHNKDEGKIKDLESQIADKDKNIQDLSKDKKDLEDKIKTLNEEKNSLNKTIEELKKLLEEAKKKAEEKPVVEDKKPSKKDTKPSTTNNNNNINIDLGRNDFEREYYRRNHRRLPFEIVYEREVPRYTSPAYTGYNNYKENRLEYIFTIGSTVYQRIMGANVENRSMDVAPYIKNDRTMLPLRYVAEAIGAEVRWDNTTRTAYFTKDGVTAKIQIDGNKIEMSDGRIFEMDSKPDNIKGRIFVSLTNISKVFNLTNGNTEDGINQQIEWNRHNKQVSISLNR